MKSNEYDDLKKFEEKIKLELDIDKKRIIDEISISNFSETNKAFQQRKKIEKKFRKKYIRYIKKKNKLYKFDDFKDVDFLDIRDLYFKEKKRNRNNLERFLLRIFNLFT